MKRTNLIPIVNLSLLSTAVLACINGFAAESIVTGDTSFEIGESIQVVGSRFIDASRALTSVDRLSGNLVQTAEIDYAWQLAGQLPGVLLTEFNQGTTSGKLSFRGFNGEGSVNAVKLLIDGVPSNTNDGNMPFVDMLFPIDIEAVEVIRGTTDPRYGLNNIAGNVAFATRSSGNYLESRLSAGSYQSYQGQVALGIEQNNFTQNYSLGYKDKHGYREHAQLERFALSGKWGYQLTQDFHIGASARHYQAKAEEPGYLTQEMAYTKPQASNDYNQTDRDSRDISQFSLSADAKLSEIAQWSSLVWLNQYQDDRFVKFSENASQQNRFTQEKHYGGSSVLTLTPHFESLNAFLFELGLSLEKQDNISKRYYTVEREITAKIRDQAYDLTVTGVYAQSMIEPTPWLRITPSYRLDWIDGSFHNVLSDSRAEINDYGTIKQPKLAIAVLPTQALTVFANWGKTFQIGTNSGAYLIPPRQVDLKPSINEGWETGIKYRPMADLNVRLAWWQQTATGEFRRKLNDPLGDFDNLGATKRKGLDLQISWTPTQDISLWGAFAWQQAQIKTPDPSTPELAGNDIDHIPNRIFSAGIDYQLTRQLDLTAQLRTQSDYYLTTENNQSGYGDFTLLDLTTNYALNSKTKLTLQLQNLTDEYYEYVWWDGSQTLHSPGQGRSLTASVYFKY